MWFIHNFDCGTMVNEYPVLSLNQFLKSCFFSRSFKHINASLFHAFLDPPTGGRMVLQIQLSPYVCPSICPFFCFLVFFFFFLHEIRVQ